MSKTKKNRSIRNKTSKSETGSNSNTCLKSTFHGIHKWYFKMFGELGWIVLAKKRGMNDKVMEYKNSLQRLKCSTEIAIKEIKDSDKKRDLNIMLDNVKVLIEHTNIDF